MNRTSKHAKHSAGWWKCPVTITGGMIIPTGTKIEAYDPFDYYYPEGTQLSGGQSPRAAGKRSLPYLFLDVDTSNDNAIAAFCEQFGMLGAQFHVQSEETGKADVRVSHDNRNLWLELLGQPESEHETLLKNYEQDYQKNAVPSLAKEPSSVEKFTESQRTLEYIVKRIADTNASIHKHRGLLEYVFTRKLGMARPQLSLETSQSQWVTKWNIGSLETAMYLMLMFDLQGTGSILKCVGCPKYFLRENQKSLYCSIGCQEVRKVARSKRLKRFSEYCNISTVSARKTLRAFGIDYSRPFDFAAANMRRKTHGKKAR